jgi:RNA polymerase sigma factor (sigma-70 family)
MNLSVADQPKRNIIQAVSDNGRKLFSFIRKRVNTDEDAEDILQDVWVQLSDVMNAEPIEQVSGWLYRVAKNKIIDRYRKKNTVPLEEEVMEDEENDFYLNIPESDQLRDIFWEQLFAELEEIPENQRQVFIWNELEEIPFQDISEKTGEKINTLISRKRYAVLHLRKRLQQLYKETIEQ